MELSALHPNLTVTGAREAIAFYEQAFGAELVDTVTAGELVVHSDLRLRSSAGTSTFTVAEAFPPDSAAPDAERPASTSFTMPVDDVDAAFARAVAAGATPVTEPGDWFDGFRQAAVRCPFGHRWFLVRIADRVTAQDVQRASDAWMSEQ